MELNQQLTLLIESLIIEGKISDALRLLRDKFGSLSDELRSSIILNLGRYEDVQQNILDGIEAGSQTEIAKIRRSTLKIIHNVIPQEIQTKRVLEEAYKTDLYSINVEPNLERIIGPESNILKINWLEKGIKASKSVCQVVRADGEKGTGFIIEGGFLITNFHVIPTAEKGRLSKIVFDYEEDISGTLRKTTEFKLDHESLISSPIDKLDYACLKIVDNADHPISTWGFLETDTFSIPQIDDKVVIIQHALGETKQIALTSNTIIGVRSNIYYTTDTQKGSSGSPVFNQDWKVIALHHAGKTMSDGGYQVVEGGPNVAANEGIPIKNILEDINTKQNQQ